VGTINLDYRSLYLHFESGVIMYKSSALTQLQTDFTHTIKQSHLVSLEETKKTPLSNKIFRNVLRLIAPLF
jgi:cardiolipin synthase